MRSGLWTWVRWRESKPVSPKPVRASISVAMEADVPHNPVWGCTMDSPMCLQTVDYESPDGDLKIAHGICFLQICIPYRG
ncbi:MAG: hypothetical protein IJT61_01965 [Bacteroidales bacterium]|nr:hypothetical protein [Bacteroidales bacterium]MBQ7734683.1 hypothetical protein [Bacteroidales bacterium]MBR6161425.1 hypothetical protein [Bacteroidales bacterium]